MAGLLTEPPTERVKIYNPEGVTVFSTEASQIGEDKSANIGFSLDKYVYVNPASLRIDGYKDGRHSLIGRDVRSNHRIFSITWGKGRPPCCGESRTDSP